MWDWLNCHVFGRHEHAIWCDDGNIFLRCIHCGRRTSGWEVVQAPQPVVAAPKQARRIEVPRRLQVVARH
jgi:hypothetical protein